MLFILFDKNGTFSQGNFKETLVSYQNLPRYSEIEQLYNLNGYKPAWTNQKEREKFQQLLNNAHLFGLKKEEYFLPINPASTSQSNSRDLKSKDSILSDIAFTDAAIHFFTDLKIGNTAPYLSFEGIPYQPDASDIAFRLLEHIRTETLGEFLSEIQPASMEYLNVLSMLNKFQFKITSKDFKEIFLDKSNYDRAPQLIYQRFFQLGVSDSFYQNHSKRKLDSLVRKCQLLFNLTPDGKLGSKTLAAINIPIKERIAQLSTLLNYLRWMSQLKQKEVVLINIPAADFILFKNNKVLFVSKIIAGKPSTPTPTLSSVINSIIFYPYWVVPDNIIFKELLPRFKRNPGYIAKHNFQILNSNGSVLNHYHIKWSSLGRKRFPYTVRQSTGCDNSLGIIKFNFENPFSVYLHDTPYKEKFEETDRFFSHGCLRLENPGLLAHLLAPEKKSFIDSLFSKGCLINQNPMELNNIHALPIVIYYSLAGVNGNGEVRFYADIYNYSSKTYTQQ